MYPTDGLDPRSDYFLEQLTSRLHADGFIPDFNMTLAQQWLLEHTLQQHFTGRKVRIQWFETPTFSANTTVKYVDDDPSTIEEVLASDGQLEIELPLGGPDVGEYNGRVNIRDATFFLHWLPQTGEITALISRHASADKLSQRLAR